MNKAVMISIQSYYVFLIIARLMRWDIPQYKKVEVRKDFPKDKYWNKKVHIYCSKSKKSFNRIPKEYQPLMRPFLGKVIGEFVCDKIDEFHEWQLQPYGKFAEYEQENLDNFLKATCLTFAEVCTYRENLPYYKPLYGWHISQLKIYDKPKELSEFFTIKQNDFISNCDNCPHGNGFDKHSKLCDLCLGQRRYITRPFQSWGYIAEVED